MYTSDDLVQGLKNLGIAPGDTLFVHSSFKALGPVAGGVETVIRALEMSLGPEGLLLMPSFNLVERARRAETWNVLTTPSTVGWITEHFRRLPDTHRSDHYSHSVAARGKEAQPFVAGHLRQEGYESPWDCAPWGKTYGLHSPMVKAYQGDAKLLMLGVDYTSSTYIHFVEVLYWHKLRTQDSTATFPRLNRPALGAFWDRTGRLTRGMLAAAPCRQFSIRAYVDALLVEVEGNPHSYLD